MGFASIGDLSNSGPSAATRESKPDWYCLQHINQHSVHCCGLTLKTIAVDQGASARGGEVSLQSGGPNKLLVKIGRGRNNKREEKIITHQDLMNLQNKVGCLDKKLKDINQFLAPVLGQKKLEL